ncbi:phage Gp37/Gp68 family protein [Pseudomonas sp. GX19020]|uniref:phage Gp37/Gp68 family protein n=1 Tax=Pseudomonas sp. GX19020 TaxID=2942277 RepID=UPI002018A937|nr:phage Gp37/Gp68 family protein [Pseudomonas sp. GX19020]MCL4068177.1 phage Gp37/Gp68 family protein [Pseudomonas sp. GX19020]
MGENSSIGWTHHTFNPVTGCQKVGPGCDNCYAEGWAKRSGQVKWGPGEARKRTTAAYWRQPLKWDRDAAAAGERQRVFCASLADVFDNAWPEGVRTDLWALIRATPNLDWMLLTKRPGNIAKMLPPDWGRGYPNVWLGCTVVNQAEADRDIPKLMAVPAVVRFLSMEPLLGPVDLESAWHGDSALSAECWGDCAWCEIGHVPLHNCQRGRQSASALEKGRDGLDLVIVGGESGPHARPMHQDWVISLRDQCIAAGVAFHFKQWGEWAPGECDSGEQTGTEKVATYFDDDWIIGEVTLRESLEMERDEEPDLWRIGKKRAGRHLDGETWDQMPGVANG